ncbi:FecCD family ABC transporter permease [Syntrophus aciditrophicus]|uniref:Iron(III) dicitrate transport system permease protein n=1 Tax=Syntrophus aciditrophicus (strain SB) TaxID=56780 RepID=Q2LX41_SYNAS|nr:iron ABC transporter permease [Syntrophus aciditrophicus]ABC78650.1 iron(III) dicitrate transport system permease protein [Syntrophus aciditrophicus SB]
MKRNLLFPALIFLLVLTVAFSMTLGRYPLALSDIAGFFLFKIFGAGSMEFERYNLLGSLLLDIRMPRILAAILIGASLAVAGSAFQAMFVNPLVSPSLLGVLAGASFGAALGMVFFKSWVAVQVATFLFGFLAVLVSVGIARMHKGNTLLLLVLGGVISSALFTSLLSVIKYIADPYNQLPAITQWLMGGLSLVDGKILLTAGIPQAASIFLVCLFSGYLNALSMGDEEARALGISVEWIRMLLIFLATLMSALTVVLAGMIGWVGLIIPHITRMLVGPNNKVVIPASALIGAIYLIVVDDVSRMLFNVEIPIGITTSLIGIPFFAIILRKAKKGWN